MKLQGDNRATGKISASDIYEFEGIDYLFIGYVVTYDDKRIVRVYEDEVTDTAIISVLDDESHLTIEELD